MAEKEIYPMYINKNIFLISRHTKAFNFAHTTNKYDVVEVECAKRERWWWWRVNLTENICNKIIWLYKTCLLITTFQ